MLKQNGIAAFSQEAGANVAMHGAPGFGIYGVDIFVKTDDAEKAAQVHWSSCQSDNSGNWHDEWRLNNMQTHYLYYHCYKSYRETHRIHQDHPYETCTTTLDRKPDASFGNCIYLGV